MSATLRTLPTKLKATTRILFKKSGADNWWDLGNITKFAHAPDRQRVEHMTAQVGDAGQGVAVGDGNLLTTTNNKYTFTGDEVTNESIRLLLQATAGSASNQTAAPTQAISISDVEPGNTYRLGYYGITGHALTFGGTSKTEGTDFTLDRNSGLLTILVGGAIVSGDDVAGTVAVPTATFKGFTGASEHRFTGQVVVELWDQFSSTTPRQIITITSADIYLTGNGEVDYTKWTEFNGEIYCNTAPTIRERQD